MGAHGGSETILCRFFVDFGLLLGAPGITLGVIWAPESQNGAFMWIFRYFVGVSKKGTKKLPKVVKKGVFWEAVDMAQV